MDYPDSEVCAFPIMNYGIQPAYYNIDKKDNMKGCGKPLLNFKLPTSSRLHSEKVDDFYNMNHKERGVAVIINNRFFHGSTGLKERRGTDADSSCLYDLMQELKFEEIILRNDLTVSEMLQFMDKVSNTDFTERDCVVCIILSYGEGKYIYGVDGKVELDKLTGVFKGSNCPSLAGKPKIFFIQKCPPSAVETHDGNVVDCIKHDRIILPVSADLFILESHIPGEDTWSEQSRPCLFVETLVETINICYPHMDLLTMMTRMMSKMVLGLKFNQNRASRCLQVPSVTSMLVKDLYFTHSIP